MRDKYLCLPPQKYINNKLESLDAASRWSYFHGWAHLGLRIVSREL